MAIYNHDLKVSEGYARSFPSIRELLCQQEINEVFDVYDTDSKTAKTKFLRYGLTALCLGIAGLVIGLVELTVIAVLTLWTGEVLHVHPLFSITGPACALIAIIIYRISRHKHWRETWRGALFARERIRQWHFQMFLDGALICQFSNPDTRGEAKLKIKRRWELFKASVIDPVPAMSAFTKNKNKEPDPWDHPETPYTDEATAKEVYEALLELRFRHQVQYSEKRGAKEGGEKSFGPVERDFKTESLAQTTFQSAIVVSAALTALYALLWWKPELPIEHGLAVGGTMLSALAILLAILNAGIRVYRIGYTLPFEGESYLHYQEKCQHLRDHWHPPTAKPKGGFSFDTSALRELEVQAHRELRRFLIIKGSASFLF
ncbi:MAG: hypothetical protein ACKVY0_19345 [Prosthecobacter sp.]|uniref:hypothetical protein n=1 Tax=Prosthecobacter sp. TaxID=1965333 RepID=UPI003901E147